jgi:hypothetical protein
MARCVENTYAPTPLQSGDIGSQPPSASRISKTAPPLRKGGPHAGRTRNAAQEARISGAPRAFGLKAVNVLGAVAMIAVAVKSKARGAC